MRKLVSLLNCGANASNQVLGLRRSKRGSEAPGNRSLHYLSVNVLSIGFIGKNLLLFFLLGGLELVREAIPEVSFFGSKTKPEHPKDIVIQESKKIFEEILIASLHKDRLHCIRDDCQVWITYIGEGTGFQWFMIRSVMTFSFRTLYGVLFAKFCLK